jgi:hypothetical protein
MDSPDANMWREAIDTEVKSLEDMRTFEVMHKLPDNHKAVNSKLTFWVKHHNDNSIKHYKAHLVAKGYDQLPGIDFDKIFAPVVKLTSVHILCALTTLLHLHFHHLNVDTAFLNGTLKEEIYMCMPKGIGQLFGKIV